jgi:hypothetical protein
MRLLYLTTPDPDYLQDATLHGLRSAVGDDCVDAPRKDIMYRSCETPDGELYGRGFTLWKLLEESGSERPDVAGLQGGDGLDGFDVVVFGSIRRQRDLYRALRPALARSGVRRTVLLDGEDGERLFKPAVVRGLYYKRERNWLTAAVTRGISFSIPEEKVVREVPREKERLFARHVQCEAAHGHPYIAAECGRDYAFHVEDEYRRDLQASRFGVTMRKAGWDCMRHYEIAANGAVPCFYQLGNKSRFCAPFGLVDMENCVAFDDARELEAKTDALMADGYDRVAGNALRWAREHTCEAAAGRLLADLS